jgi:hypothetical protein
MYQADDSLHGVSARRPPSTRKVLGIPVISMFYGIIVSLYFFDTGKHQKPHIHARYQEDEVVMEIPSARVIEGTLPRGKMKLLVAWIELHQDELLANWELAVRGEQVYSIEPLK